MTTMLAEGASLFIGVGSMGFPIPAHVESGRALFEPTVMVHEGGNGAS